MNNEEKIKSAKTTSSGSSSCPRSNHSYKCVKDLIQSFDKTSIKTCVIGIQSMVGKIDEISHTSLFLSDIEAKKLDKKVGDEYDGIIIEYGLYNPKKDDDEKEFIKAGYVIYRYGEKKGGLRYFINNFKNFKKYFGDIAYMTLEVNKDNQISFSYLLEKIAPKDENKWILKNYWAQGFLGVKTFNCRTFVAHALNVIKPIYDSKLIKKGKQAFKSKKGESLIPKEILEILKNYENNY